MMWEWNGKHLTRQNGQVACLYQVLPPRDTWLERVTGRTPQLDLSGCPVPVATPGETHIAYLVADHEDHLQTLRDDFVTWALEDVPGRGGYGAIPAEQQAGWANDIAQRVEVPEVSALRGLLDPLNDATIHDSGNGRVLLDPQSILANISNRMAVLDLTGAEDWALSDLISVDELELMASTHLMVPLCQEFAHTAGRLMKDRLAGRRIPVPDPTVFDPASVGMKDVPSHATRIAGVISEAALTGELTDEVVFDRLDGLQPKEAADVLIALFAYFALFNITVPQV